MKSLDTNIIVRFLVNDDKEQGLKVRNLFEKAEKNGGSFFIPIPVLLETLWVLKSVYHYTKNEIIKAIESLDLMQIIEFERVDAVKELIKTSNISKVELDDLLIGITAKDAGCDPTITFDLKSSKSELFELLK